MALLQPPGKGTSTSHYRAPSSIGGSFSKYNLQRTPIVLHVIPKQVRDTERDPRGCWPLTATPASRVFTGRVVEALGNELGELLHPRGEETRDDAARVDLVAEDESTEGGAPVVAVAYQVGRRRDATRPPGRHSDAGQSNNS